MADTVGRGDEDHSDVRDRGQDLGVGRYDDLTDSFHIYGSYFNESQGFLKLEEKRSFGERTWPSFYAEPMFKEVRERLQREKSQAKQTRLGNS